jgi:GAF domain-containing protein
LTKDEEITKQELALSYLGMPIITSSNVCIGAVCAINSNPKAWTTRDVEVLEEVTVLVNRLINLYTLLNTTRTG